MKVDLGIVRCPCSKQNFCDFRAISGAFWGPFACCKISAVLPGALGFTCSSPISSNFSSFCFIDTVSTPTGCVSTFHSLAGTRFRQFTGLQ